MQFSIGKLATTLVALLIMATVVTTAAGLYVLEKNFSTLEDRRETEAHDTVRSAAVAIRNQVRFYQEILQLIAANPEVINLIEFGDVADITRWSLTVGRLLPGTIGTALTSPSGVVFGDPLALRVGAACQADLRHFASGDPVDYPMLHTDVSGLEHFDLLTRVHSPSGEQAGTLFVSFRLAILEDLLDSMAFDGDRFVLLDRSGKQKLTAGGGAPGLQALSYRQPVPDTSWELVLYRPVPPAGSFLADLLIADLAIVAAVAIFMIWAVRAMHLRFISDMGRVHQAFEDVFEDRYQRSAEPTAIKEVGMLLNDIEQLAVKIQDQRNELRHQSLSDPLTGVFNRRYFDLMLAHFHEQSRRHNPATLVIVDLNDFKHVNDEFGHSTGDRVLQHVAGFLRSRVRATDIVARLGGDEFAVLLNQMDSENLHSWLSGLVDDYDRQVFGEVADPSGLCHLSIGAALIDVQRQATPADVFRAADGAMYSVKERREARRSRFAIARPGNVTPFTSRREVL